MINLRRRHIGTASFHRIPSSVSMQVKVVVPSKTYPTLQKYVHMLLRKYSLLHSTSALTDEFHKAVHDFEREFSSEDSEKKREFCRLAGTIV